MIRVLFFKTPKSRKLLERVVSTLSELWDIGLDFPEFYIMKYEEVK